MAGRAAKPHSALRSPLGKGIFERDARACMPYSIVFGSDRASTPSLPARKKQRRRRAHPARRVSCVDTAMTGKNEHTIGKFFARTFLVLLLAGALGSQAMAAPATAPAAVPNSPAKVDARVTAVDVQSEGTDSIGARLSTALKEKFNTSSLFRLGSDNEPKLVLLVSTSPEFPTRPQVGSVYSIIWVYSQKANYLPMLLGHEVGTVSMEDIDALVARVVEKTDGLSVKYGYLWKKN